MKPEANDAQHSGLGRPKKIGELLIETKAISNNQLDLALQEQKRLNQTSKRKFKLGEILLFLKYIVSSQLHSTLLIQHPRSTEDTAKLAKLRDINARTLDKWLEKKSKRPADSAHGNNSKDEKHEGFFGSLKGFIRS